jgi:peptidoglycan/LPS O-acetylase OafA/YrhL
MMFTSVSFAGFSAMLAELACLKTRFLKFFGRISLEFYVYQGLVMILLRNPHFQTSNDFLFFLLVLCGASLFGWLMHLVDGVICSGWKKLIRYHTKEIGL